MLTRQDSREEFERVCPLGTVIAVQNGGVLPVGDSSISGLVYMSYLLLE
jgi:hypothetical protein